MASLLGIARAASQEAKRLLGLRLWAHGATFVFTLMSFAVQDPWTLYPVLGAVLAESIAWAIRFRADTLHHSAEQARRSAVLMNAFGLTKEPADAIDLRADLGQSLVTKAESLEDSQYYASTTPPGPERLREVLQESAFWSKHLYATAASWSFVLCAAPILLLGLGAIILGPLHSPIVHLVLARVAVSALTALISVDQLSEGLAWRRAADIAVHTDHALGRASSRVDADMLAVFAEYSVGTASAHPIPEWIYRRGHQSLEAAWKLRANKS